MYRTVLRSAFFRLGLAAAIGLSPAAAVMAQQPRRQPAQPQPAQLDLRYATPLSFAGVIARPRQVLTAPNLQMLPYEVFQAAGVEHLGIDPVQVEEVQVFVEPPASGPPQALVVVRFAKGFDLKQLKDDLTRHTTPDALDGRPYLRSASPTAPSLFASDDRTLLVGMDEMLRRAYAQRNATTSSPLIGRLQGMGGDADLVAAIEVAPLRPLLNAQVQQLPPLPAPLAPLEGVKNAPNLIEAIEASVDVTTDNRPARFDLVMFATDEQAAEELEKLALAGLELWQQQMLAAFDQAQASDDPIEQAMGRYMKRVSGGMAELYRPVRAGEKLVFFGGDDAQEGDREQLVQVATIGILVALLLPAVQAAREAARRTQSTNNLKQLILGLLNYESANGHFPPHASYSPDGKPLLSWRVHILPYLEEQALYSQFRLDEPWDSEHNQSAAY
jgi:hypothetical protein